MNKFLDYDSKYVILLFFKGVINFCWYFLTDYFKVNYKNVLVLKCVYLRSKEIQIPINERKSGYILNFKINIFWNQKSIVKFAFLNHIIPETKHIF